jgi:hypothetical protein
VSEPAVQEERALDAFDLAMQHRQSKDWEAAQSSLLLAIERDPHSPALRLWLVQTHLDAEQTEQARRVLDEAVRLFPESADCLYNRAALRARLGDIGGAADDLKRLKALGLLDPFETGSDPDFVDLRDDPIFADLVEPPRIQVQASGEDGAVLLGDPWELVLTLGVPLKGNLELSWEGEVSQSLQLESVIEQELRDTARERTVELRVRWRAIHSGIGRVGPWKLRHGQAEAVVEAIRLEVVSLGELGPGQEETADKGAEQEQVSFTDISSIPIPRSIFESVDERGVAFMGDWIAVQLSAYQSMRTVPEHERVLMEWRSASGTVERAEAFAAGSSLRVDRLQGDKVVSSIDLPRGPQGQDSSQP